MMRCLLDCFLCSHCPIFLTRLKPSMYSIKVRFWPPLYLCPIARKYKNHWMSEVKTSEKSTDQENTEVSGCWGLLAILSIRANILTSHSVLPPYLHNGLVCIRGNKTTATQSRSWCHIPLTHWQTKSTSVTHLRGGMIIVVLLWKLLGRPDKAIYGKYLDQCLVQDMPNLRLYY